MKTIRTLFAAACALLILTTAAAAAAPSWMPNFPMRMGAAGVMGMWMPVPGATEYKVYRQIAGGAWEEIAKGPMNNFQDPTAPVDKDVAYKVVSVIGGADGEASPSATLAGQKALEPPKTIRFRFDAINKAVGLGWNSSDGGSFYNVYRSEQAGAAGTLLGSVQDLKYTDAAVKDGKTYYYAVSAVGTSGQESPRSESLQVDVKFRKVRVVKKFDFTPVVMGLVGVTQGEEWDEFKNPSDILFLDGRLYVACEDGIQVTDADGVFVKRLPLVQEMVASREWSRPFQMAISPDGNLLVVHISEKVIREITLDGAALVSEVSLPDIPGHAANAQPRGITFAPNGDRWATDTAYGNLVVLPAGAGNAPGDEAVQRHGFIGGRGVKYDPETDGEVFVGAGEIGYAPKWDTVLVLESAAGKISGVDPATGKKQFSLLGIGGGMNQVSLLADFLIYDENSVLITDSLKGEIKQIKIAPGDDTNGDYLASFVDDPEGKLPKLQSMVSNVTKLQLDRSSNRLYALSVQGQEVAVYTLP